ncbi:MAG: right-handed parallel beta-helix repeat-containing protein [Methanosarcinales archaeon]|jgi:parallel beta-helix repeat protein|nr:right-handed parallel beta-helix repeat-containing protein [Methanosarcinales archaeon]
MNHQKISNPSKTIGKSLLVMFLILFALTGVAAAEKWTVGGTDADFQTLPEAVTAASDGDTILIRSGTYETAANISISKTLTITGENRETVILDLGGYSIIPKKENFVLQNMTIQNGSNGINLQINSVNALIENCIFEGLTHKDGIKLAKDGAVFKNNLVRNTNGFTNVVYVTAADVRIIGNTFAGLLGNGNAARIICLENASNTLIENNTIQDNDGEAIRLWRAETSNAVITQNVISGNTQKGIYFYNAGEGNAVYLNDIFDNEGGNIGGYGTLPEAVSFNSPERLTLSRGDNSWTGNAGNYWGNDYDGADTNGNGIGSTQKTILDKYADLHPLTNSVSLYTAGEGFEDPEKPGLNPGKTGNSISMTTTILPSVSVSFSIDSLDFGELAAGQTGEPKEMEVINSGSCDIRVTAEVTDSSDDLYKRGIWIDNSFWPAFEKVIGEGKAEISEVVLKVPADYKNTGQVDGALILWVEAC